MLSNMKVKKEVRFTDEVQGRAQEKLSLSLEVAFHGALDALVEAFLKDPTLCYTLDELDATLQNLCKDPYNTDKQVLAVKAVRLFFKSVTENTAVHALVKEKAGTFLNDSVLTNLDLLARLLESVTQQPVLKIVLEKLDTVDFDELFVTSQKDPYVLMTTLGRQVLIPVLQRLFTKIRKFLCYFCLCSSFARNSSPNE